MKNDEISMPCIKTLMKNMKCNRYEDVLISLKEQNFCDELI